jgi:UDP-N-acetylglucosamine 4-epimerase
MNNYGKYHNSDLSNTKVLITGGAGFIGSHLVEYFINNNVGLVRILDNLSTGSIENIKKYLNNSNVEFLQADITDVETCKKACMNIDYVLHQAALGSVPRSINNPSDSTRVNVDGFVNVLHAAHLNNVKRVVYASSSSVYGDHPLLPKTEEHTGNLLSPYAATKAANEMFGKVMSRVYNLQVIGLRYFNVFGERQNPNGAYAAVIPLFIKNALNGIPLQLHGDGMQTRDFTYIQNVVQANLKALFASVTDLHTVMNIACGDSISLNQIIQKIQELSPEKSVNVEKHPTRSGDIKNSLADFNRATSIIQYSPQIFFEEGFKKTFEWFKSNFNN